MLAGYRPPVIYQHPLAYLVGLEGLALLRAWGGDFDREFVEARLAEVRRLLDHDTLTSHPGAWVREGRTGDVYGQWAETYDDPGNGLFALDEPVVDEILDRLPIGTALDTACGTGRLAARLAGRGHQVVGVDDSPAMLRRARRQVPGVPFVRGDLQRLPVRDDAVDVVTSGLALTHVADLEQVLNELARVVRPGGAAIITDVHPEHVLRGSVPNALGPGGQPQQPACHRHPVGDHLRAALAAGFRVRRFDELYAPADHRPAAPSPREPEIGAWRDWPWTLLDWVPDAARAAWDVPAVMVWHLELD